jgi:hypothetical protein
MVASLRSQCEAVNWLLEVLARPCATFGEHGFDHAYAEKRIRGPDAKIAARPWAKSRGYVADLTGELHAATCYVAPIDMGGGMKTKIMEAMACGLPIVGNPEAFSGLSIEAGAQAVVSDRGGFVSAVLDLLESPSKRAELGRDARKWIVENAGWDMGAQSLHDIVIALAATASAQSGEKINEQDHQGLAMRDQSGRDCLYEGHAMNILVPWIIASTGSARRYPRSWFFSRAFWDRVSDVFDSVRVLARVRDVVVVQKSRGIQIGHRVEFVPVRFYHGPWQYLMRQARCTRPFARQSSGRGRDIAQRQVGQCLAGILRKIGHPYGMEVIGALMMPLPLEQTSISYSVLTLVVSPPDRRLCSELLPWPSSHRKALQRRYPAGPRAISKGFF